MRSLDDYNYHNDSRVRAGERRSPFQNINPANRTADVLLENEDGDEETCQVRLKREVCPTCDGEGKHVNPSIDAGGISAEDFERDPRWANRERWSQSRLKGDVAIQSLNCFRSSRSAVWRSRRSSPAVFTFHESES